MFAVAQLLQMNIAIRKAGGAFWEQALSRLLYKAVEENYDYALVIDYDTAFESIDVNYLLRLIASQEDAVAVFPMQYRRGINQVLCSLSKYPGGEAPLSALDGHLVRAKVGSFALTAIRVSKLKEIPHPWLWSQPNAEGKWEDGKIDADIYFWNKLHALGAPVYVAPRLMVGHMQQMVTWPDENLKPKHQYIQDYLEHSLPDDIKSAAVKRTEEQVRTLSAQALEAAE